MKSRRDAFTLIEVLISIALLSLVLLALYNSVAMLQKSNTQLFSYLQHADREKEATEILFMDIAGSDGNISIRGHEFSRLCLEQTDNSLYGLPSAKVCWVVSKEKHLLLRSEGNGYTLPSANDERIEVDVAMKEVELFRAYRKKSDLLVLLQQKGKKAISFIVQGVPVIPKKSKKALRHTKVKPDTAPAAKPGRAPGRQSAPARKPGTANAGPI